MKLLPFSEYKDSNIPYLGKVPEHWGVLPLKRWVRMNDAVLPEYTNADFEFDYLDIGSVGIGILVQKPQRIRFRTAPSRARRIVKNGDTIVSTVRTYLKAVWHVDNTKGELIVSTGFVVLTPRQGTLPKFASYLVQNNLFTDRLTAESVGIAYPAIAESRLGTFHVSFPPLPEQTAIVRYLDYFDRRIRRYIGAKQKLIKLLEEQKQVVIHRAVTRGLDPDVPLKPSGVEWLGEVPKHWELVSLCAVSQPKSIVNHPDIELLSVYLHAGVVKFSDVAEKRTNTTSENLSKYQVVDPGDFVLNNQQAWRGSVGISKYKGIVSPAYLVLSLTSKLQPQFANLLFRDKSMVDQYLVCSKGVGSIQRNLYWPHLKRITTLIPPIPEQTAIVEYLDKTTADLDTAITRARRGIDLLQEYRTRLIADVVTGKLDVREAAAALPDESVPLSG